jgi:hypothetical protein
MLSMKTYVAGPSLEPGPLNLARFGGSRSSCYTWEVVAEAQYSRPSVDSRAIPSTAITLRPDSSVVERGPEKAGVGGSIPSLATTKSTTYGSVSPRFSFKFIPIGTKGFASF